MPPKLDNGDSPDHLRSLLVQAQRRHRIAGMSEEHKKPGWLFWAAACLIVPLLYVASVGPACRIVALFGKRPIESDAFCLLYAPLIWLELNNRVARTFFAWYVGLWMP